MDTLGLGFLFALAGLVLSISIVIAFFYGVRYLKEISLNTRSLQIMVENELRRREGPSPSTRSSTGDNRAA